MCWFPFFKSSKRRKKSSKRERRSEKEVYQKESYDYPGGGTQAPLAQTAQYGTFVASSPPRAHKPRLHVEVPDRAHRKVRELEESSSTEMLLNPRPERTRPQRVRHHRSTTTLRGRGAKRDPPTKRKPPGQSKRMPSSKPTKKKEYTRIISPPPTPSRRPHRHHHQPEPPQPRHPDPTPQPQPYQYQYQNMHAYQHAYQPPSSHQHHYHHQTPSTPQYHRTPPSSRSTRDHRSDRHPNTSARRAPDGRFAVRAATNQALEDIRREAFLASPQPRMWRAHGVAVNTAETPFNWDCVSSSGGSGRRREGRRRH